MKYIENDNEVLKSIFIDKITKRFNIKDNNIIFPEIETKQSSGLFVSDMLHNMIYTLYLLNKYDNLTIPTYTDKNIVKHQKETINKLIMQNIPYNQIYIGMRDIILFGYDSFYLMMKFIVLWYDKHNYWIDDKFNEFSKYFKN